MTFRDRLMATIRAARPVLEVEGVLVVGSEVPNLLEPGAAATLVVSQDLDIGVPVERHAAVKQRLGGLHEFEPSSDEPSVWTPRTPHLLELNFVGMDSGQDPAEAYILQDDRLPLLVFGALSLVTPGDPMEIEGTRVPLPRPSGLVLEKLITDRTGEKGERDLLVALGLLAVSGPDDLEDLERTYRRLRPELRHAVRANLTIPLPARSQARHAGPEAPASGRRDAAPPAGKRRSGSTMTETLEQRLRQHRSRLLVRSWDYRQRRHARGVWFRLRRVLARASDAYAISREQARELIAEGHQPEPVGQELEPPRLIIFATAGRVAQIASARPLEVRLSAELLAEPCLALIPFESEARAVAGEPTTISSPSASS